MRCRAVGQTGLRRVRAAAVAVGLLCAWTAIGQEPAAVQDPPPVEAAPEAPAEAAPEPAAPVHADQVVVLLDSSGSMSGLLDGESKMTVAKRALKAVLARLPAETHVGVLTFDNTWIVPLGPRDEARMLDAINAIQPSGPTPLGQFVKRAADALLEARARQFGYGSYRLLVVTDGVSTDGELLETYAPDVLARGIVVDAVGVDMAEDHLLKRLAHSYRRANSSADLEQAVAAVFAEVGAQEGAGADAAAEAVFAAIQPLDPKWADRALTALAGSGNHPIGTQAEGTAAAIGDPGDPAAAPASPPAPALASPVPPSQPVPESSNWRWIFGGLIIAAWLTFRAKRRKSR